MSLPRLEHIGIVVDDLTAATAFFTELGLEVEGTMTIEDEAADRITAVRDARSRIAMLRTPDGHGCLELIEYERPAPPAADRSAPSNTPGLRHVLFEVADIDDVLTRLEPHGAELVGEVVRYADSFRLCYLRGPAGIIVELAEKLG